MKPTHLVKTKNPHVGGEICTMNIHCYGDDRLSTLKLILKNDTIILTNHQLNDSCESLDEQFS